MLPGADGPSKLPPSPKPHPGRPKPPPPTPPAPTSTSVQRPCVTQLFVPVDPTRIGQILSNLLDNARRHTPAGGQITIDLAQTPDRAEITVTDTGPGVPSTARDRIFDRLVRLAQARDRDTGGAGLGLSIARGLARAHQGELSCLAHPNGARFQLTLPTHDRA
ncbi:MAG: ATP-binding protein [Pseudonocardiales bacterium]|nr:ATP-binding protein [Pseudonocardiales bacterium]